MIVVKNYAGAVIKIFCSSSIYLISLLCSTYFVQDCLSEQIFVCNFFLSSTNFNISIFLITSMPLANILCKHLSCAKVQNLMVFGKHSFMFDLGQKVSVESFKLEHWKTLRPFLIKNREPLFNVYRANKNFLENHEHNILELCNILQKIRFNKSKVVVNT